MTPSRLLVLALVACALPGASAAEQSGPPPRLDIAAHERARVLKAADAFLAEPPITITAFKAEKSAGGVHDYFSQADYSWPDPTKPDGLPFVNRDGWSNPDTFGSHRWAMVRLSRGVGALGAAFKITGDRKYADHAVAHLRAWFVTPATRMNPSLLYSQAILGIGDRPRRGHHRHDPPHRGRRPPSRSCPRGAPSRRPTPRPIKSWFRDYLAWLTTSEYGIDERDRGNNHGTCWVMQVAAFARMLGDRDTLDYCRTRFKTWLLPNQMFEDGSFPLEMRRTKPYGYCALPARSTGDGGPDSLHARRQSVDLHAARRSVAEEGRRLHVAVHRRQVEVDAARATSCSSSTGPCAMRRSSSRASRTAGRSTSISGRGSRPTR